MLDFVPQFFDASWIAAPMSRRALSPWRVGLILFASGLAALVYQVAWMREFRLVFGASTAANAAVLAVFIGGLGAGGLIFGSRADRASSPLALYAVLELGAAGLAALSPLLLAAIRFVYVELGGSARLGMLVGTLLRLVLGAIVLTGPTLLMGGAMPAAVAAVETDEDKGRRRLALLYGLNTLGAVVGTLLATFVLLERLGTHRSLWGAAGLGASAALLALWWARRHRATSTSEAPTPAETTESLDDAAPPRAPVGFVLFAAGAVGFAFFLMEIVWYRMLGPLLGGTVFTFGVILAVALLGIGLGSTIYGYFESRGRRPTTLGGFAAICMIESACMAYPFALGDRIAYLTLFLRPLGSAFGFSGHILVWGLVTSLVVLPAAIASGVQFPVLIGMLGHGRASVGRQTGLAYAANTLGAILGSLAGGFGLLPLLTAPGCWRLVTAMLACLALVCMFLDGRERGRAARRSSRMRALPWLLGGIGIASLLTARGPSAVWRHSPIAVGRVEPASVANPTARHDWANGVKRSIAREADGVESTVALEHATGFAFVLNGKTDGHARMDAGTQVMGGLLGALLHPGPRRAFVIGLGTGSTSGWLAAVPSIERVDTVELEPSILDVARACARVNHDVMANPKHHIIIGDARETLLGRGERYDIIASEPSNPYRAGIASLFTREYYQAVERRLAPEGLFLQWVQAYAIDGQTFRTILATLAGVFPAVEIWSAAPSDLLLVSSRAPLAHDVRLLRSRMSTEPFRSALLGAWNTTTLEGVLAHYVARPSLARGIAALEGSAINTDDRTVVEFGFARALSGSGSMHVQDVVSLARERHDERPTLVDGIVDDARVADEGVLFKASLGIPPMIEPAATTEQRERYAAVAQWLSGEYKEALASWRRQPRAPDNVFELMVVGDGLAESADDGALAIAEQLRGPLAPVADGIVARLAYRQGRLDDAARALEASFIGYRTNPWPAPTFMLRTLSLATEVARKDAATIRVLFRTLQDPFAVDMMDEARWLTLVDLARLIPPGPECVLALAGFEPNIPWRGDFLSFRAGCYAAVGFPLAAEANQDLMTFERDNPPPFPAVLWKSAR
jgi:spermidine synthase